MIGSMSLSHLMPRRVALPTALVVALVMLLGALPGDGQETPAEEPPAEEAPAEAAESEVDRILEDDEEVLSGEGYTYDPGNRRDPFRSLLAVRSRARVRGPRPEGIPGLLIDEIDLTGVFVTGAGTVAQILSADKNESFLLREGDQLYDGDVVSITLEEIKFRQIVDDPSAIKPFREVVKRLNP